MWPRPADGDGLNALAGALRDRLLAKAGEDADLVRRIRDIVEREAGVLDEAELRHAIERVLAPLGRRVDEARPLCDAAREVCPLATVEFAALGVAVPRAVAWGGGRALCVGSLPRRACSNRACRATTSPTRRQET